MSVASLPPGVKVQLVPSIHDANPQEKPGLLELFLRIPFVEYNQNKHHFLERLVTIFSEIDPLLLGALLSKTQDVAFLRYFLYTGLLHSKNYEAFFLGVCRSGNPARVELVIRYFEREGVDFYSFKESPLKMACETGNLELLKLLIPLWKAKNLLITSGVLHYICQSKEQFQNDVLLWIWSSPFEADFGKMRTIPNTEGKLPYQLTTHLGVQDWCRQYPITLPQQKMDDFTRRGQRIHGLNELTAFASEVTWYYIPVLTHPAAHIRITNHKPITPLPSLPTQSPSHLSTRQDQPGIFEPDPPHPHECTQCGKRDGSSG